MISTQTSSELIKGIPVIALAMAGGRTMCETVADFLRLQVPVLVLNTSGGMSDILSFAQEEIRMQ